MGARSFTLTVLAASVAVVGCNKPAPPPVSAASGSSNVIELLRPPPGVALARVHWVGKERLSAGTNAAHLLSILDMPESARLGNQTLDKLSRAPWNLLRHEPGTNAASLLLRPLLDDIVRKECYFEMRQATNQTTDFIFAIRLDDARAELWTTNLGRVLESLTGLRISPAAHGRGWSLKKHDPPNYVELTRAGGWMLLGAAQNSNALLAAVVARLEQDQSSPVIWSTNYCFEFQMDPRGVATSLPPWAWPASRKLPDNCPLVRISVMPDGNELRTEGELNFPSELLFKLPRWNIPLELIDQPLSSFTAVRGIGPILASLKWWKDLRLDAPPDQGCSWALQGLQMQTYFAAPSADASNTVTRIANAVITNGEPWFASHDLARFVRAEEFPGMEWRGLPFLWPFLRSIETTNGSFILGGCFSHTMMNPLSPDLLRAPLAATNLVYHDWEATGLRSEQWVYMGQFIRLVSKKAQLPFGCASLAWIKAAEPRLGNSVTQIAATGERRLSLVRRSAVGFTGIELQLLADWLESRDFPLGLHTFGAAPE